MIIEMVEILTPDIMALLLLIGMVRISGNVIIGNPAETRLLKIFISLLGAVIVLDIINRTVEGMHDLLARVIIIVTNYLLFLGDILFAATLILFILSHAYGHIQKGFLIYIHIMVGSAVLLLLINCFVPIIFCIDSSNRYSNGSLYFLFDADLLSVLPAGIIVYLTDKERIGSLEFFSPVFIVLPVVIGEVLSEICLDKVSTILPMFVVSAVIMLFGLLHEAIYRDKLTGLYDRFYLDGIILNKLSKSRDMAANTALMMDLNYFKAINDRYGHKEGDEALITVGTILAKSVIGKGKAIRYAGDEFIVIMSLKDENEVEDYISQLKGSLEAYNQTSQKNYDLSLAIGYKIFDTSVDTMDNLLKEIDNRMYEDKKAFYATHTELCRRKV